MNVERVFHMTGGAGDTSYAKNSSLQKGTSDTVKGITIKALGDLCRETTSSDSIGIADLGCSSGPNTLSIVRDMIDAVEEAAGTGRQASLPAREIRVYLNDLPTNDFNSIFAELPDLYAGLREGIGGGRRRASPVFIAVCGGSFYGRLFPSKSLDFVHSSLSLHWLSKVPEGLYDGEGKSINKGNIYISETSPPAVPLAYTSRFQEDFSVFLRCRSQELTDNARMVLIFSGRYGPDHVDRGISFLWNLLTQSIALLVSKGEVEEEKLNSYEVNFYAPSREEIVNEVQKEGSFKIERLEMFESQNGVDGSGYGKAVRAVHESMLRHHFGDDINLDALFENFQRLVDEEIAKQPIRPVSFIVVLTKGKCSTT